MTRLGFEASILALFIKSVRSLGTDSLSVSSRETAFTHKHQNQHCEVQMYTLPQSWTMVGSGKALTTSEQRCCGDGVSGSGA